MQRKHLILFLGSGLYSFPLMAEGLLHKHAGDIVQAFSAAMKPTDPHALACEVMKEIGIELTDLTLRTPLDIEVFSFDMVVTLGTFDPTLRLNLPGMPPHFHWELPLPADRADPDDQRIVFRAARDRLEVKILEVLASEMLSGLHITQRNLMLVLDNLADGVMAHTMNRRIFFFNKAAEVITGFKRGEILGKDCHRVFRPQRFCGGDCSFCTGPPGNEVVVSPKKTQVIFKRQDGTKRNLDMTVMPLSDAQNTNVGALVSFKDTTELANLQHRVKHFHACGALIGKDPKTLALFEQIREVGPVTLPVLIEGESGTGKELVARAIHDLSPRARKPFLGINCGALPEGILESELFGHVRGAFTGAVRDQKGRFELADGGTLLLDEVGELSPTLQVKLLRVLQEKKFERVGGEKQISVDVRIVSATNRNLRKMMEEKRFRRDLFYRLCVVPILVPPLRERRMDIPVLIDNFLESVSAETEKPLITISNEALDILTRYPWPGNVRELRNVIEYAYVKCRTGCLVPQQLPNEIVHFHVKPTTRPGPALKLNRDKIIAAMREAEGNKSRAAAILGVGRSTLYRYMRQHAFYPESL